MFDIEHDSQAGICEYIHKVDVNVVVAAADQLPVSQIVDRVPIMSFATGDVIFWHDGQLLVSSEHSLQIWSSFDSHGSCILIY